MNEETFFRKLHALPQKGWKAEVLANLVVLVHPTKTFPHCDPITAVCLEEKGWGQPDMAKCLRDPEFEWSAAARLLGLPDSLVGPLINPSAHPESGIARRLLEVLFGSGGNAIME